MKKNVKNEKQEELLKDDERREFLEKFGKLTATVPVGMLLLMGPHASVHAASGGNDDLNFP